SGYAEALGPLLLDRSLWEATWQWENFREKMFISDSRGGRVLAVKPMNCPGHGPIVRNRLRSYRELPRGLAELVSGHRNDPSGPLQLDFQMPERLGANYVGEDGQRYAPYMLHRTILGSMERFIGILIEHYAGHFPLWLAPVQAVVASIVGEAAPYAEAVARELADAGLRVITDTGNETINYKVREHSLAKVPLMLVVG